jgi:hypothetical protein
MTCNLDWELAGDVKISEGRPVLPDIPAIPGLYRLQIRNGWWYFGESQNLRRRLSDYVQPGEGVESEHRLYYALIEGGGATLELLTSGDLSTKSSRCAIEFSEIKRARSEGEKLLNGIGRGASFPVKMSIKYHEAALEKLRSQLAKLSGQE